MERRGVSFCVCRGRPMAATLTERDDLAARSRAERGVWPWWYWSERERERPDEEQTSRE